jgi:hypothetical protein
MFIVPEELHDREGWYNTLWKCQVKENKQNIKENLSRIYENDIDLKKLSISGTILRVY